MKFAILVFSGGCLLTLSSAGALAQGWPPWADNIFRSPRSEPWVDPEPRSRQRLAPLVQDGGARPELLAEPPPVVAFAHDYPANSIVWDIPFTDLAGRAIRAPWRANRIRSPASITRAPSRRWSDGSGMRRRAGTTSGVCAGRTGSSARTAA